MQNYKALFLIVSLFSLAKAAQNEPIEKIQAPAPSLSDAPALTVAGIAGIVGFVQIIRGSYRFFKSSDDSLDTKTLSDFEEHELTGMTKEKLAKVIARENERSKNTLDAFQTVLNGIVWISVSQIAGTYGTGYLRDFQAKHTKTT